MNIELGEHQFDRIARFIEEEYGISVPPEKKVMVQSRLAKRVLELRCESVDDYIDLVLGNTAAPDEVERMLTLISTHLTAFFREAVHFDQLVETIVPAVLRLCPATKIQPLVVWSAACSTGEEVYSLAMTLAWAREALFPVLHRHFEFAVLGTDLSRSVVDQARQGIYPSAAVEPVPAYLRQAYLMHARDDDRVRVVPEIRRRTFFHDLNLMETPYQIKQDVHVIFCRNVLIYFNQERRIKVLENLCRVLVPGGYLVVGHAESIMNLDLPLRQVAPTVYRRTELPEPS